MASPVTPTSDTGSPRCECSARYRSIHKSRHGRVGRRGGARPRPDGPHTVPKRRRLKPSQSAPCGSCIGNTRHSSIDRPSWLFLGRGVLKSDRSSESELTVFDTVVKHSSVLDFAIPANAGTDETHGFSRKLHSLHNVLGVNKDVAGYMDGVAFHGSVTVGAEHRSTSALYSSESGS